MRKVLIFLVAFAFILASCGKVNEQEEVKYSEIFNDGKETISYLVKNSEEDSASLGKDSEVVKYIVSKKGKIAVYSDSNSEDISNTKLGKVIKMKDKDKMDYIKNRDKESFSKNHKEMLNFFNASIDEAKDGLKEDGDKTEKEDEIEGKTPKEYYTEEIKTFTEEAKKVKKMKYKEPSFEKLAIEVSTDETGNRTEEEFINIAAQGFDDESKNGIYRDSKESADPDNYGGYFTNPVSPKELYDTKIAGLSDIDYVEEDNDYSDPAYEDYTYLVTEVGDKTEKFKLDQPDDDSVKEK